MDSQIHGKGNNFVLLLPLQMLICIGNKVYIGFPKTYENAE